MILFIRTVNLGEKIYVGRMCNGHAFNTTYEIVRKTSREA
jgi:hypothetical protein